MTQALGLAAEAMFGGKANTLAASLRVLDQLPGSLGSRPGQAQAEVYIQADARNVGEKETV